MYRNKLIMDLSNIKELIGKNNRQLLDVFDKMVPWREEEFDSLIPYALKIRNRFTVFNIH